LTKKPFENCWGRTFVGLTNVWGKAAYKHGLQRGRLCLVHSNAVGHAQKLPISSAFDAPTNPITFYGLAKCFSENLASIIGTTAG